MKSYPEERLGAGRLRVVLYIVLLGVLVASVYHGLLGLSA
jgi:hypothetical protein